MLKDILAIIEGGKQSASAVDAAIAFAALHKAHLGVTVLTERILVMAAFDAMAYTWPSPEREAEHVRQLAAVRERVAKSPVPVEVRGLCEEPALLPGLTNIEGRYADLVLIGPEGCWTDARLRRHVIEANLLGAGVPVLLHPSSWTPVPIRHAVLGWNASAQASQAARALIAVAKPGARIDIVVIDGATAVEGRSAEPGSDIARHLACHGFNPATHVRSSDERPVADILQSFTAACDAQMLAIGAYAHSRFREILFGGVTRDLIEAQRLPVLMAH